MKRMIKFLLRCAVCGTRFETHATAMSRDEKANATCSRCEGSGGK